jgi:hypothetical protein
MSGNAAHHDKERGWYGKHADPDGSAPESSESAASAVAAPGGSTRERSRSKGAVCFEAEPSGSQKRIRLANDTEADMGDSVQVMEPDAREFCDALPELRPPGSGARLPDCGVDLPGLFCQRCGVKMMVGRTCRRSVCPRCWESWAFQRAKTNAAMVEGLRRYRAASGEPHPKAHHLTVSFPSSTRFDSTDAMGRGYEVAKLLLEEVGVYAGVMIYHPWRIAKPYRGDVQGHESGDGDMEWAEILTKIASEEWSWEAAREEFLVYGPHFHVYANAPFVQGGAITEEIEDKTGVVIHRITKGEDSSVSLYDTEDLVGSMAYSLSHAGLSWDAENEEFRAAYRRFGETANFSPTASVEADVEEALREVAPEVLGQEFPEPRCDNETVDVEEDDGSAEGEQARDSGAEGDDSSRPTASRDLSTRTTNTDAGGWTEELASSWNSGNTGGYGVEDGEDLWTATRGVTPEWLDDPEEAPDEQRSQCGAKLVPMWAAPEYLDDEGWVEKIGEEARAELEAAYKEWEQMSEPRAEAVPPPDVPDPPD